MLANRLRQQRQQQQEQQQQQVTSSPAVEVKHNDGMDIDEVTEAKFWDNLSGEELDPKLVKKARVEDMDQFVKHNVYVKVPVTECYKVTGKPPIGTRWVDINKGDKVKPGYRSRLVAQEFKTDNVKIYSRQRPRWKRWSCCS